ncbi:TPA: hypothetical protein ACH3X1_013581 [Trebouxia sp. C0004]
MGGAKKIRSRNSTLRNAWRQRAPAAAPERKRHFGIRDVVPPELRPEVVCRAEAARGPPGIEFSDDALRACQRLKTKVECSSGASAPLLPYRGVARGGLRCADSCKRLLLQLLAAVRA